MTEEVDIAIVGAGMAGVSLAAAIGGRARVIVIEGEERPGMHATGRSAALFAPGYGAGAVQTLTLASESMFADLVSSGVSDVAIIRPRPCLHVATPAQAEGLAQRATTAPGLFELIDAAEAARLAPILRQRDLRGGLLDRGSGDLDVDALLQAYLKMARRSGVMFEMGARVDRMAPVERRWRVSTSRGEVDAAVVVNAAGAWADEVAVQAGVQRLGLQPKRRTAALVDAPAVESFSEWPAVIDIDERFYFKPDAGRLLVSPAEETDMPPHDASADDEALAEGIERICAIADLVVEKRPTAWAGLRTFAPDRAPVVGFDRAAPAPFFWLAGQGGYGIQMAPALAAFAAAHVLGQPMPDFSDRALLAAVSPSRFRA